ncbi:MAG: DNA-directed RNA polymerase subunit beta [Armatimonadota bacterium]
MKEIKHASKRTEHVLEVPNLIELQLNSYKQFLEEGLPELLQTYSPIWDFTNTNFIEFTDFCLGEPKYSVDECRDRDMTFEAPLKVQVRVGGKDREVIESEVYFGDLPLMTDCGTFIVNGRERVIVSQLARSPGIYFEEDVERSLKTMERNLSLQSMVKVQVIPSEGPWIDFEQEPNHVVMAAITQTRKIPVTQLIKAIAAFDEARIPVELPLSEALQRRLAEPLANPNTGEIIADRNTLITPELLKKVPAALREKPAAVYAAVGTNEDLMITFGKIERLKSPTAEDLIGKRSLSEIRDGEDVIIKPFTRIDPDVAMKLQSMKLKEIAVVTVNEFIDASLDVDPTTDTKSAIIDIHRQMRPGESPTEENARNQVWNMFFDRRRYDLGRVGRQQINRKFGFTIPLSVRHLTVEDLVQTIHRMVLVRDKDVEPDDIDHLANKRVRAVGELLASQMRVGFARMEKVARERMTSADPESLLPSIILSIKPISASIKSFFSSNQLSSYMDQTNPLSELTNKRRLSTLGPGGLERRKAKLQVRDVHRSHYGRICPIETPEGPNIGLISQLTMYARVDDLGLIQTPFRIVRDGIVTDEIVYLPAGEDDQRYVAPADAPYDPETRELKGTEVQARHRGTYPVVPRSQVELMDVSPVQIISAATALIPFLENDDANRALMGANMQRQAVPLLRSELPIVATGYEDRVAQDAGAAILSPCDGVVESVTPKAIAIRTTDGKETHVVSLSHMRASNKSTCFTHRPIVFPNQRVRAGQPIADGPTCDQGGIALGKNLLVAFMPWNGYNYEDAILLSERLVREDVYTSIHIARYDTEASDTKLGPEEITRDIPNVGEDALKDLDEQGIVRIGAEVRPEDILVGKVAPKGQVEMTAEERLIIAIFGKKAEETRDVSLRLPHGERGTVVDVKIFSRFKYRCKDTGRIFYESKKRENLKSEITGGELEQLPGDELPAGVNMRVQVYVALKRRITEGDKMAGRHGNKGVISRIMPVEDMPFLQDGTPVDIVLNPLGVPSRMNIGQILETHLGYVGYHMGVRFLCPAFEGSTEDEVMFEIARLGKKMRRDALQAYVRTELGLDLTFEPDADPEQMLSAISEALRGLGKRTLERISRIVAAEPVMRLDEMDPNAAVEPVEDEPPYRAPDSVYDSIIERVRDNAWRRAGLDDVTGKSIVRDGLTGDTLPYPITVGCIYMLKLEHLADEKIHARSIGPYSLVTQQPLGGKAQFGGQRFGEMEVWALEAYGAAATLQEILTIKSDDVQGRVRTYESIVRGETILEPGIPESFKILVNELRSLCLKVTVEDANDREISLKDLEDPSGGDDLRLARSVGTL